MQALLSETEKLLDTWKHPDPYVAPTAPGGTILFSIALGRFSVTDSLIGSKYERNLPSPVLERKSHSC